MSGINLRTKRVTARISGAEKLGIAQSKLSGIERGLIAASPNELRRINKAIEQLTLQEASSVRRLSPWAGRKLSDEV